MTNYKDKPWFQFLDRSMQDLAKTSYILLDLFQTNPHSRDNIDLSPTLGRDIRDDTAFRSLIHDYSFIVFPMAKAYEGFLKKWLFTNKLIDKNDYLSDHFRLGKALNPSLDRKFRDNDYVYDKIVANCSDPHLADRLWDAWKECRNLIFHYFPDREHLVATTEEAQSRLNQLTSVMAAALQTKIHRNY